MTPKNCWIDKLRAATCLMVIHTITGPMAVTGICWDVANLLNSASHWVRTLFFMFPAICFLARAARRGGICCIFCSVWCSGVAYITWLTPISEGRSLLKLLQNSVFYHL